MASTDNLCCPKCGDTKRTSIGNTAYRCANCATIYHINDDEIVGFVSNCKLNSELPPSYNPDKYSQVGNTNNKPFSKKTIKYFLIGGFILLILLGLGIYGCYKLYESLKKNLYTPKVYFESYATDFPLVINNELYLFTLSNKDYSRTNNNEFSGSYYNFININTSDEEVSIKLDSLYRLTTDTEFRRFEGDRCFTILQTKYVLEIDKSKMSIVDITDNLFVNTKYRDDAKSGIERIEFANYYAPHGFIVKTKNGNIFTCNPFMKTSVMNYGEEDYIDWIEVEKDTTYYAFSYKHKGSESMKYSDLVQLVKVKAKYRGQRFDNPRWE